MSKHVITLFKGGTKERKVPVAQIEIYDSWHVLVRLKEEGHITADQFEKLWDTTCIAKQLRDYIQTDC